MNSYRVQGTCIIKDIQHFLLNNWSYANVFLFLVGLTNNNEEVESPAMSLDFCPLPHLRLYDRRYDLLYYKKTLKDRIKFFNRLKLDNFHVGKWDPFVMNERKFMFNRVRHCILILNSYLRYSL